MWRWQGVFASKTAFLYGREGERGGAREMGQVHRAEEFQRLFSHPRSAKCGSEIRVSGAYLVAAERSGRCCFGSQAQKTKTFKKPRSLRRGQECFLMLDFGSSSTASDYAHIPKPCRNHGQHGRAWPWRTELTIAAMRLQCIPT